MVSSALSSRRRFLRRPKVCKASPNPGRCHPPPPPPPPIVFPPVTIPGTSHFDADGLCLFAPLNLAFDLARIPGGEPNIEYFASGAGGAGWWDVRLFMRLEAPFTFTFRVTTGMIWWCGWAEHVDRPYVPEISQSFTFPPWTLVDPAALNATAAISW